MFNCHFFQHLVSVTNSTTFMYYLEHGVDTDMVCKWPREYSSYLWAGLCSNDEWDVDYDCDKFMVYKTGISDVNNNFPTMQRSFFFIKR